MPSANTNPLKSEERYKRIVAPFRDEEKQQLATRISAGLQPVIRVWYNTILSDYPVYEYCCEKEIPYAVENVYPSCDEAAIAWICIDQLKSRMLSDEMRWYLIGKRCLSEYILGAHAFVARKRISDARKQTLDTKYDSSITRTRDRIGNEYDISIASVMKYENYCRAIDTIYDISKELAGSILDGTVPTSYSSVINLADESADYISEQAEKILNPEPGPSSESEVTRLVVRKRAKAKPQGHYKPNIAIKDMPPYDPDAEITTLSLTIPSWISSMKRVRTSPQLSFCSYAASRQLHDSLINLIRATSLLIASIMEEPYG